MGGLDKVLLLNDQECVLYYKNGRQLVLRSGHGRILELLDWFLSPDSRFASWTEYQNALKVADSDTQEIDLEKLGA